MKSIKYQAWFFHPYFYYNKETNETAGKWLMGDVQTLYLSKNKVRVKHELGWSGDTWRDVKI